MGGRGWGQAGGGGVTTGMQQRSSACHHHTCAKLSSPLASLQVHRHKYAEANARLNNRDIFGRFVLEWIASSSAQLSLRCRRLEQGAAGQHGWSEFASDGELVLCCWWVDLAGLLAGCRKGPAVGAVAAFSFSSFPAARPRPAPHPSSPDPLTAILFPPTTNQPIVWQARTRWRIWWRTC